MYFTNIFLNKFQISKISIFHKTTFHFKNPLEIFYARKVSLQYINKTIIHKYAKIRDENNNFRMSRGSLTSLIAANKYLDS